MSNGQSDAFVFFGATGDLAYKKIFPALQAMAKRGHLDVPVIGVAKAGWTYWSFVAWAVIASMTRRSPWPMLTDISWLLKSRIRRPSGV